MLQKVDLQERLKMRFLTVDYRDKQEVYGTSITASDTGAIALDILNIPDYLLEVLLELTEPMMQLVDFLNHNKNPEASTLAMMLTASKNVFRVVDLLRDVPPFSGQDFTWLDGKLPKIFSQEAVNKAYRQRKKEMGEVFIPALCLVAQLGFGIRDFRQALIPLVEALAAGNAPKRCPICQKFFLTTNTRRQKYCTGNAPEEYGGLTCVQVGNRMGREAREKAENRPAIVQYHQAMNALDKRVERGTSGEKENRI